MFVKQTRRLPSSPAQSLWQKARSRWSRAANSGCTILLSCAQGRVPCKSACQRVLGMRVVLLEFQYVQHCHQTNGVLNGKQRGTKQLVAKAGPQSLIMVSPGNPIMLRAAARHEQGQTLSREQRMLSIQVCSFCGLIFF